MGKETEYMNLYLEKPPNFLKAKWNLFHNRRKPHFMKLGLYISFQELLLNPVAFPQDTILVEITWISGWASTGHDVLVSRPLIINL